MAEDGTEKADEARVIELAGSGGEVAMPFGCYPTDVARTDVPRYLEGRDPSVPASASPAERAGELQEIQRRIEALERAVYLGDRAAATADGIRTLGAGDAPPAEAGDPSVR